MYGNKIPFISLISTYLLFIYKRNPCSFLLFCRSIFYPFSIVVERKGENDRISTLFLICFSGLVLLVEGLDVDDDKSQKCGQLNLSRKRKII